METNWKSRLSYRYRPEGIFHFFRPESGPPPPPPVRTLLQRQKANAFVPAIVSPLHGLFTKGGGLILVYVFRFPEEQLKTYPQYCWEFHDPFPNSWFVRFFCL